MSPIDFEEQSEILSEIVPRLELILPAGWQELRLDAVAVGDREGCVGSIRMSDGTMRFGHFTGEIEQGFARLRAGMAHPQRGAWLQAFMLLEYPDIYSIEYKWDGKPRFTKPPVTTEDATRELEKFPRDAEFIPEWMRNLISTKNG